MQGYVVEPQQRAGRLNVQEGLVDVGEDVFEILNADGEAHEAVGDADAVADFLGHGSVRHLRGKRDERLDSAKAFGERADLHLIEEAARGFLGTQFKRKHGAGTLLLSAGEIVLRMIGEAWVIDFADFGVSVEVASDGEAVGVVLQHADG